MHWRWRLTQYLSSCFIIQVWEWDLLKNVCDRWTVSIDEKVNDWISVAEEETCFTKWISTDGGCINGYGMVTVNNVPELLQCLDICKSKGSPSIDVSTDSYGRCYCNTKNSTTVTVTSCSTDFYEYYCQSKWHYSTFLSAYILREISLQFLFIRPWFVDSLFIKGIGCR